VTLELLYWPCAAASLLGTWWNVQRRRACFALWIFTNAVWSFASFTHDLPAKGCLHIAYLVLAVVGLLRWKSPPPCARCGPPSR